MRPGADHRTQNCRKCHRGDQLESAMVPAAQVLGEGKRGWFCPGCAGNGGTRFIQTTACSPVLFDLSPSQGCPATLNGQPCILHPRNGHTEHVSPDLEVWA
jgi:hypothetical protein